MRVEAVCASVLNHFSTVWLFVTPWTVTHQAPLSMKFSRQEYWSGLPFPFPVFQKACTILNSHYKWINWWWILIHQWILQSVIHQWIRNSSINSWFSPSSQYVVMAVFGILTILIHVLWFAIAVLKSFAFQELTFINSLHFLLFFVPWVRNQSFILFICVLNILLWDWVQGMLGWDLRILNCKRSFIMLNMNLNSDWDSFYLHS